MKTFETADSPLDFAYIAPKSSRFFDPDLLREVAHQYGETKNGLDTAGALEYIDQLLESRSSYVEFHYSRITQLCSLLQDKHGDVLRRVLNHVRQDVTAARIERK